MPPACLPQAALPLRCVRGQRPDATRRHTSVQKTRGTRAWTGLANAVCVDDSWTSQIEHGETCSPAEATGDTTHAFTPFLVDYHLQTQASPQNPGDSQKHNPEWHIYSLSLLRSMEVTVTKTQTRAQTPPYLVTMMITTLPLSPVTIPHHCNIQTSSRARSPFWGCSLSLMFPWLPGA